MKKPKLINDWSELSKVEDSETHKLDIGKYSGWIVSKNPDHDGFLKNSYYLSTHTFYGGSHQQSTKLLQKCGFNVEVANWDDE